MSFSRVQLKSSREHDRQAYHPQPQRERLGLPRVVFSAISLLFAASMYYVAMHYIPALASPSKTIRFATETETIPKGITEFDIKPPSAFEKLLGPYFKLFALDRAYMRSGETIQIKFDIPQTTTVDLDIVQCRRIWVIEIFNCKVISQFTSQKGPGRGIATFTLGDDGFYHFRHRVNGLAPTDTYRLVWERVRSKTADQAMVNPSLMRN